MINETTQSAILTAVTGMAKTLYTMREEQKNTATRLDAIEQSIDTLKHETNDTGRKLTEKLSKLIEQVKNAKDDLSKQTSSETKTLSNAIQTKLTNLIDVIGNDTAAEDTKNLLEKVRVEFKDYLVEHETNVMDKLDKMNQLKLMSILIEALSTMQKDVTTLTSVIESNNSEFKDIVQSTATMSARLGSVDLRLASFQGKESDTDADANTLLDIVELLETQNNVED